MQCKSCPSYLISLLMCGLDTSTYHVHVPSFEYIAALLRVSTVLQFPSFRQFAIHKLEEAWPCRLEEFTVALPWIGHAAETVALARDCSVPGVLKRALYALVMTPGFSSVRLSLPVHRSDRKLTWSRRIQPTWICFLKLTFSSSLAHANIFPTHGSSRLSSLPTTPACNLPPHFSPTILAVPVCTTKLHPHSPAQAYRSCNFFSPSASPPSCTIRSAGLSPSWLYCTSSARRVRCVSGALSGSVDNLEGRGRIFGWVWIRCLGWYSVGV